jgi:hypothetical protein
MVFEAKWDFFTLCSKSQFGKPLATLLSLTLIFFLLYITEYPRATLKMCDVFEKIVVDPFWNLG